MRATKTVNQTLETEDWEPPLAHYAKLSDLRRWLLYKGFARTLDNGHEEWHFAAPSGEHIWARCFGPGQDPNWIIYTGTERGQRMHGEPEFNGPESALGYMLPTMDAKYMTQPKFRRWVCGHGRNK